MCSILGPIYSLMLSELDDGLLTLLYIDSVLMGLGSRWATRRHILLNTNGAAAKVTIFDRLGKKLCPGTFGKINVG